jgi:hypothetical protein
MQLERECNDKGHDNYERETERAQKIERDREREQERERESAKATLNHST